MFVIICVILTFTSHVQHYRVIRDVQYRVMVSTTLAYFIRFQVMIQHFLNEMTS